MNQDKNEYILIRRLLDLANMTSKKYSNHYSDFLNLNEQNIFYSIIKELPNVKYKLFGGFDEAERQILAFYNDDFSFPISCIKVEAKNNKFSKMLTHRDFLGSLISLGIDRSKLGDIIVSDNTAYIFCHNLVNEFILSSLKIIKHTNVTTSPYNLTDFSYKAKYKEIKTTVSSIRLDSLVAASFNISRSKASEYITRGRAFVNGKSTINKDYILKENDIISIRGLGKFSFKSINYTTKKNRLSITNHLYI